jgi:hypothetical protein
MFVRYRKLTRGGSPPRGVQAKIACQGQCLRRGRDSVPCPFKPRCRWRIGLDREAGLHVALAPYRLQVQLIENRREGGRVRQEHVATLGAINAWFVPEFWHGIDPAVVAKIKADNWDALSVKARAAFWEGAKPRLDRLVNRIDPKTLRMAIHQRIPWPMQAEREEAEAREDFRLWQSLHGQSLKIAESNEKLAATATANAAEARQNAHDEAIHAAKATERLAKLARRR